MSRRDFEKTIGLNNKELGTNMLKIVIKIRLNTSSIPADCVEEFDSNCDIASKGGEGILLRRSILDPLITLIRMVRDVRTTIR